jgi:hypothetical protein
MHDTSFLILASSQVDPGRRNGVGAAGFSDPYRLFRYIPPGVSTAHDQAFLRHSGTH